MMKSRIIAVSKLGGVIAVSFEWVALLVYYLSYPSYFGRQYPISYYATLPGTRIAFSLCYLAAALSFYLFAQHHLRKHIRTPTKTFAFSMACFGGTALVPYYPTNIVSSVLHITLSVLTFGTFILGVFLMARSDDKPTKSVSIAAGIFSGALLILLLIAPKGSHYIFALEAGSWFVCQLWILWVSYRAYRLSDKSSTMLSFGMIRL